MTLHDGICTQVSVVSVVPVVLPVLPMLRAVDGVHVVSHPFSSSGPFYSFSHSLARRILCISSAFRRHASSATFVFVVGGILSIPHRVARSPLVRRASHHPSYFSHAHHLRLHCPPPSLFKPTAAPTAWASPKEQSSLSGPVELGWFDFSLA
ncbi:hypothetical protein B0H13DRAFT_2385037 [Mycena leptocephala]|nr:hypothetical protein B0H13DRAFT_2385037 [Mycena leptocephala]